MKHHWRTEKIVTLETAAELAGKARAEGKRAVTLNGAFDLLHAGHLDMLEEAKQQGDVLFVGINSDASVKDGKGEGRPFIGEQERAATLAALICTDFIIIIDAPYKETQDVLIETVKPHVHVNGSEYGEPTRWLEWPAMQKVGAVGHAVERRPGLATSALVEKIIASTAPKR